MKLIATLAVLGAFIAPPAMAAASQDHAAHHSAGAALTQGEVRKVDKDAKKLTIRHAAIANLDMPPMTMVFQVKDAAMLDLVKAGDKIRFSADKVEGAYVVTQVEADR